MGGGQTEREALEASWGTDACGRCGAVIVLGDYAEQTGRYGHSELLCADCSLLPQTARPQLSVIVTPSKARGAYREAAA